MNGKLSVQIYKMVGIAQLALFRTLAIRTAAASLAIVLLAPFLPANSAEAGDVINFFRSTIVLTDNATLYVKETIDVDFGKNQHHGIVREIPCSAIIKGDKKRIHITATGSSCDHQNVQNSVSFDNEHFKIKIGDPNRTLSGPHEYTIEYTVYGAVRLARTEPEIYWNITGNDWKMPIKRALGTLVLPDGLDSKSVKAVSFEGMSNATSYARTKKLNAKTIEFGCANLAPGMGLTMAASLPPNSIQIPGLISEWAFYLGETALIAAATIAFLCGCWPIALLFLLLAWGWGSNVQNANWDSDGSSCTDFGSSGGGFGGGGGDTW